MSQVVRDKLCQLIIRFGDDLGSDARRCGALLRDVCGEYKRETSVLEQVAKAGIPAELVAAADRALLDVTLARLAKRLHDELGLAEEFCRWGVESWAIALRVVTEKDLTFPFECPVCHKAGAAPRRFAGRSAKCPQCKTRLEISADGRRFTPAKSQVAAGAGSSSPGTVASVGLLDGDNPFSGRTSASAEEMLRQVIRRALADRVITGDEHVEMLEMQRALGIPPEVAARIFGEVEAERTGHSVDPLAGTVRAGPTGDTVRIPQATAYSPQHAPPRPPPLPFRPSGPVSAPVRPPEPVAPYSPATGTRIPSAILAILLGAFGVHMFVTGNVVSGLCRLAITFVSCGYGAIITVPLGMLEGIIYLTMTDAQFHQTYIVRKRGWF